MNKKRLSDVYRFKGFIPKQKVYEHPVISNAVIIPLRRIQKKRIVRFVVKVIKHIMTIRRNWLEIYRVVIYRYILKWKYAGQNVKNIVW
jgi:hypothetical protein